MLKVLLTTAPEVGIPEDLAKFYFAQLHSAVVSALHVARLTCPGVHSLQGDRTSRLEAGESALGS